MKNFILALLLLQNGPQVVGVVTGVVHGPDGKPASGVRVFALEARESIDAAKSGAALESISVTDESGRYRLEIAAGRYHIASGSMDAPTFSPGTLDISAANAVRVTAGNVVENIDIFSFVAPSATALSGSPFALPPNSNGVLAGTIRHADGTPAAGLTVTTIPIGAASLAAAPIPRLQVLAMLKTPVRTDANGNYRIPNVSPGTYYIAAGMAEAPEFYPGTSDSRAARIFATTPATNLSALDFIVSKQTAGFRVSGRVTATGGVPAVGATVQIQNSSAISQAAVATGLPSSLPAVPVPAGSSGQVEFLNVPPGTYVLRAWISGVQPVFKEIVVADQPVQGIELSIPATSFSGRIVMEDGSALPAPQAFGDAIITTVNNPYMESTIMPISAAGTFSRLMEFGEYRFSVRTLPEGYAVKSVTVGEKDLLRETIKVDGADTANVEIRVAKKNEPGTGEVRLYGKAIDVVSGAPAAADSVTICCRESGISERFSTPLRSDGSFEFRSIPPGRYYLDLQVAPGHPALSLVNSGIAREIGSLGDTEIEILTAQGFIPVLATTVSAAGGLLDVGSSASVVFVGTSPQNRIVATLESSGIWSALLPLGDVYTAKVENAPSGYSLKSTSDPLDFRTSVPTSNAIGAPTPEPKIVIVLSPP